jgi:hypothetical protein
METLLGRVVSVVGRYAKHFVDAHLYAYMNALWVAE